MIDTAILDQLRGSDVTRAIVADRVKLKKEGKVWKGCCPFHTEKSGSFTVFQDGGWRCFGCHETGLDAIAYVEQLQGVGFIDAAKTVASARGIDIDVPNGKQNRATARIATRRRSGTRRCRHAAHRLLMSDCSPTARAGSSMSVPMAGCGSISAAGTPSANVRSSRNSPTAP
jgi:DNA primase